MAPQVCLQEGERHRKGLPGVLCSSEREGWQKHGKTLLHPHSSRGHKGRAAQQRAQHPACCPYCLQPWEHPVQRNLFTTWESAAEQPQVLVLPAGMWCQSHTSQQRAVSYLPCELVTTLSALKLPHSFVPVDVDTQLLNS